MDTGDIVYYIAIILIGLLSGFFKKKKQRPESKESETDLRDIIDEILQQKPKENREPILTHKKEENPLKTTISDSLNNRFGDKKVSEYQSKTAAQIIKDHQAMLNAIDEYDNTSDNQEKYAIDIRQAVIQDAILNRPDF